MNEEVEAELRQAAAAGDAEAAFQLGVILHERDPAAALGFYEQAAETGDLDATMNIAHLYAGPLDRQDQARRVFREAIERGHLQAMFDFGWYLWAEGDHEGAEESFRRAADAGAPRAHLELGFLFADQERGEDALAAFTQAAALGVGTAWTQAGWELARLGRLDEAEGWLRRAWEMDDRVSGGVLHDVLAALDRQEEADAIWRETVAWATSEVSLDYREQLDELVGEGLDDEELAVWAREQLGEQTPRELAALLCDAARLAEAETHLLMRVEEDEGVPEKLAALYEMTGRAYLAEGLREWLAEGGPERSDPPG